MQDPTKAAEGSFKPSEKAINEVLSKDDLALLEESLNPPYKYGSGDIIRIDVFGRSEISGKQVIGPDGIVTLPVIGNVYINDMTRDEAQIALTKALKNYFTSPTVTIAVEQYTSNQVTVLGRVANAGKQQFANSPTLAEVLANAGALPILDKQATLTRCAIFRGREKLIWVDLKAMLNGDPSYNMRMRKGDIVFIPDSSDTSVYVMGSVFKPGSYRLTPRMTVLDAIAQAGGPNDDAKLDKIGIYRASTKQSQIIDYKSLIGPYRVGNYGLEDGDVIYFPSSAIADFGYFVRQLSPALSVLTFGIATETYIQQTK
jgi:polysaccharide export outer membrane protein